VFGYLVECWTVRGYVLRGPSAMYGFQIYPCPECLLFEVLVLVIREWDIQYISNAVVIIRVSTIRSSS